MNIFFWTRVLAVTRRLLKRGRMKTGDKRSTRKSSCHSRGGVSTRNFERTATRHPVQVVIFTFREFEFSFKKLLLCDRSRQSRRIFFEKIRKNEEARGHRALGSPRAGSVFASVQRHWLLKLKVVVMKRTQSRTSSELRDM
jgi:hypothetical protein